MTNELETHAGRPNGQRQAKKAVEPNIGTRLGKCLVLSTDRATRETISQAAIDAGWDPIVCTDELDAMAAVRRTQLQLAWIDLDAHQTSSNFRELCTAVAALPKIRLVVCGHENDAQEEIWARQLGIWVYLPGLSLHHTLELTLLCEQAQQPAGRSNAFS